MTRRPHSFVSIAIAAFLFVIGAVNQSYGQKLQINALKASYAEGFIDFARWDGEIERTRALIGVVGAPEIAAHLESVAQSKKNGRKLEVLRIDPNQELPALKVLFVGSGYKEHWPSLIKHAQEQKILIIGEEDGFIKSGGIIEFVIRKNRLRFFINPDNAHECGIEMSSQLTELAIN